jgi:hypothetical protein
VLLKKVHEGAAGSFALLILMNDLRYSESINCADALAIARQAWDTGLRPVQLEALDFIHSNARALRGAGYESEAAVIELLETFDVKENIVLSTQWLETRSSFSGFETGIGVESALDTTVNCSAIGTKSRSH